MTKTKDEKEIERLKKRIDYKESENNIKIKVIKGQQQTIKDYENLKNIPEKRALKMFAMSDKEIKSKDSNIKALYENRNRLIEENYKLLQQIQALKKKIEELERNVNCYKKFHH